MTAPLFGQELEYASLIRLAAARPELRYLFYHATIQEAVYEAMLKSDRRVLHRAVAEALERSFPDRLDDLAATLGHHYGKGNVPDKAVSYLTQAAGHSRKRYANREAIALYYSAIGLTDQLPRETAERDEWRERAIVLRECVGDVLDLVGQHQEARVALQAAHGLVSEGDLVRLARLQRKIGRTWVPPHEWAEALQAYQAAEAILGPERTETELDWWQEWTQIQTDRMLLYYWQNRPDEIDQLAAQVRPIVERVGSPAQRAGFYRGLVMANMRQARYRISDQLLADMQAYLAVQQEVPNQSDLAFAYFLQGFIWLWHGDLQLAEQEMETALGLARQIGDVSVESRCLTYQTVCRRMFGQVADVQRLAVQSRESALVATMPEYVGTALANLAWVAWRQGNLAEAESNGLAALQQWQKLPAAHASCAFEWTALLPMIAIALTRGQADQAIEYVRALLDPARMRLADSLEAALGQAVNLWEAGEFDAARAQLQRAVEQARIHGFL